MVDLTRKRERDRLPERREPYWHRLEKGMALGFRRGPDTWVVRLTSRHNSRDKTYHALDDLHLDFDEAKKKADKWLEQVTRAPVRKIKRVLPVRVRKAACRALRTGTDAALAFHFRIRYCSEAWKRFCDIAAVRSSRPTSSSSAS